jgi:hypothetical protein
MKLIITVLVACCINSLACATIFIVSNNATYPGQYSTVPAAVNAATAGDTIYVYPGWYPENISISKRLVIIGSGINPQRPSALSSTVNNLTISSAAASGSVLMGISIYASFVSGTDANPVNNLILSDCQFTGITIYGSNVLIENCILQSNYATGGILYMPLYGSSGNILQNNYIHGAIALRPGTNTIIRNNIFASGDANTAAFTDLQQGEPFGPSVRIWNNIFFKSNPTGPRGVSDASEFKNNIYHLTGNPTPVNVLSSGNINADPQFVSFPIGGAGFSFAYNYHLQPASPGINYGTDGKDVGMWGGPVPVNTGFEPPIPRIYEFTVNNATVPAGGTIQLTIKATKAQ